MIVQEEMARLQQGIESLKVESGDDAEDEKVTGASSSPCLTAANLHRALL